MATSLARRLRDPTAWSTTVDVFAILVAISLPWSTSLVAIFAVALLLTRISFLDLRAFLQVLRRPICLAPLALVLLACAGTLWSDADWGTRLHAINPTTKLLMLPVLFYHFQRSERGLWVFLAFMISCTLLTVMSWIVLFHPELSLRKLDPEPGIFVKNYIDQSQEFALCAVALAYPIITMARAQKPWLALLLSAIVLGFFLTMAFVVVSRTALVTMPIMIAVFGVLHFSRRTTAIILCAAAFLGAFAWAKSPQLQSTFAKFSRDYELYTQYGTSTSIGERLEYWKKSLRFYAEAPTVGHGTGSTRGLFEHAATGPASSASAQVIGNPHNQTLNVAVQWGSLGVAILYSIWIVHLLLFRGVGFANWIGLLVVVQNIFTSLFNSHLFDFHEGWMYVVGVGVAGGMVLKTHTLEPVSMPIDSRSAAN
jgi:O-antigen ligase